MRQVPYPHPGEILMEEFLRPMGITQYRHQLKSCPQSDRLLRVLPGRSMRKSNVLAALLIGLVLCIAGRPASGAEKPWLVFLLPLTSNEQRVSVVALPRELIRQSILLSAREEFGAMTRDANCSELLPNDGSAYAGMLMIEPTVTSLRPVQVSLQISVLGPDGKQEKQSRGLLTFGQLPELRSYEKTIEHCEIVSRAEACEALRAAGLPMCPANPPEAQPKPLTALQQRLDEMCYFAQFDVLRQVHPLLRQQPDSEELLTMAARSYAHLGQLTRCNFDNSFDVYVARSLLYAQRLVQKHKGSALALQTRAYAKALTGLHASALDDLKQSQQGQGAAMPLWAKAAELLCCYSRRELLDLAGKEPAIAPLARYFAFLTVQHEISDSLVIETSLNALKSNPHCFRLIDGACEKAGVSYLHQLTEEGFPTMVKTIRDEWPTMEADMPEAVRLAPALADNDPDLIAQVADMSEALAMSDAPSEPSWSMLGNLMEQTDFLLVWRRVHFMVHYWSVPTSDYLAKMKPLYDRHALKAYLLSLGDDYRQDPAKRWDYLANVTIDGWFPQMLNIVKETDGEFAHILFTTIVNGISRTDYDWPDMLMYLRLSEDPEHLDIMRQDAPLLYQVSPYDPVAASMMIAHNWRMAQEYLPKWKKQFELSPLFLATMAKHCNDTQQPLEAAGYLEQYLAIAPDISVYQQLADDYLAAGQADKSVATLKRSLQVEDYGLMHAQSQLKLAAFYRAKGDNDKCIEYAELAAQTGAQWAMLDAARYNEELTHWDRANLWHQRAAERYGTYEHWHAFCVRSGHGDREAATRGMEEQCREALNNPTRENLAGTVQFNMLERKYAQVTPILRQLVKQYRDPWAALLLAVSKDDSVSREDRIEALRQCSAVLPADAPAPDGLLNRPYLNKLARLMAEAMSKQAPLNPGELKTLKEEATPFELPNLQYPAAMYLIQIGRETQGLDLLKECDAALVYAKTTWQLAHQELRDRNLLPAPATSPATRPISPD